MALKVFLSHSTADSDDVRRLARALEENGIPVWFDEWDIVVGDQVTKTVQKGLSESTHLALWITRHAIQSGWVEREWQAKYEDEVKSGATVLLPLLAQDCDLPPLLGGKKYADFRHCFETGLMQLLQVLTGTSSEQVAVESMPLFECEPARTLHHAHSVIDDAVEPELSALRHLRRPDQLTELPHAPLWQDRPELQNVQDWWRGRGTKRICALVGVGGAGKTALAARFVDLLADCPPMLIFSFYRSSPDDFFAQLMNALEEASPQTTGHRDIGSAGRTADRIYVKALDKLASFGPCLLILDALDTVQFAGEQAKTIGSIRHDRLRDFMKRLATREFHDTYVLITSRLSLGDFGDLGWDQSRTVTVEVGDLCDDACVKLLTAQGVHNPRYEIEPLLRECGGHALAVELAGSYLRTFCDGNVRSSGSLRRLGGPSMRGENRFVTLEFRLKRIVDGYRSTIARHDPLALDLLLLICVFGPVSLRTLSVALHDEGSLLKKRLVKLTSEGIQRKLLYLMELRLVRATASGNSVNGEITYSVHTALEELLLVGISTTALRNTHRVALNALILEHKDLVNGSVCDYESFALCERLIRHSLGCQEWQNAWHIYHRVMGGYQHLGAIFGEFERGASICELLDKSVMRVPGLVSTDSRVCWQSDWALYALHLGDLATALRLYRMLVAANSDSDTAKRCRWLLNLADVYIFWGNLDEAFRSAHEALCVSQSLSLSRLTARAYVTCGYVEMLAGSVSQSLDMVDKGLTVYRQTEQIGYRKQLFHGVYVVEIYTRLGMHDAAIAFAEEMKSVLLSSPSNPWTPTYDVVLAHVALAQHKYALAEELVRTASKWGRRHRDRYVLLASGVMEARLLLAQHERTESHNTSDSGTREDISSISQAIEGALAVIEATTEIARSSRFGIFLSDLALLRARIALLQSDPEKVFKELEFIKDKDESNPLCERKYLSGYAQGHQLFAEAVLLQMARKLGGKSLQQASVGELHTIEDATKHFELATELLARTTQGPGEAKEQQPIHLLQRLQRGELIRLIL